MRMKPSGLSDCKLNEGSFILPRAYDEGEFRVRSDWGGRSRPLVRGRAAHTSFAHSHRSGCET